MAIWAQLIQRFDFTEMVGANAVTDPEGPPAWASTSALTGSVMPPWYSAATAYEHLFVGQWASLYRCMHVAALEGLLEVAEHRDGGCHRRFVPDGPAAGRGSRYPQRQCGARPSTNSVARKGHTRSGAATHGSVD